MIQAVKFQNRKVVRKMGIDMIVVINGLTMSEEGCEEVEAFAFRCMTEIRNAIQKKIGQAEMDRIQTKALVDWSDTFVPAGAKGEKEWKLNLVKAGLPEEVTGETFNLTAIKKTNESPIEFRIDVTSCQINRHFGIRLGFDPIEVDGQMLNVLDCLYEHDHVWAIGNCTKREPDSWQSWQIAKIEQVTQ